MYELIGPHRHYTFSHMDIVLFTLLVIWSGVLKGIALWKAGRNNQVAWFVAMLLINTAGILEIIYLTFFKITGTKTYKKRA